MPLAKRELHFETDLTVTSAAGVCEIRGSQHELTFAFTDFATLTAYLRSAAAGGPARQQLRQIFGVSATDAGKLAQKTVVTIAGEPLLRLDNSPDARRGWLRTWLGLPPVVFEQATVSQRWQLLRLYLQLR